MGCGGSKAQQDVATGNTVSAGKLPRREAAASESKASSTTTDATSADGSLKSSVDTAEIAVINGSLEGDEKSTTLTVVKVVEEEQPTTSRTPDEYLSPRKDGEMVEEEADFVLPSKVDDAANGVEGNGMGKELKESETKAEKEEKERSLA